jgi:hypothetical protein
MVDAPRQLKRAHDAERVIDPAPTPTRELQVCARRLRSVNVSYSMSSFPEQVMKPSAGDRVIRPRPVLLTVIQYLVSEGSGDSARPVTRRASVGVSSLPPGGGLGRDACSSLFRSTAGITNRSGSLASGRVHPRPRRDARTASQRRWEVVTLRPPARPWKAKPSRGCAACLRCAWHGTARRRRRAGRCQAAFPARLQRRRC